MSAIPQSRATDKATTDWAEIAGRAPGLARTMGRYLDQIATFLAPTSVDAADNALRQFAGWLLAHTEARVVANVGRAHVEDYKVWLAARPGHKPGSRLSANTQRQRLRTLRAFFDRIIEWDWPDAPMRNPVIGGDLPPRPEP